MRHSTSRLKCLDAEDLIAKTNPIAVGTVGSPLTFGVLGWSRG
jgi:hypothetical protein